LILLDRLHAGLGAMQQKSLDFGSFRPYNGFCAMQQYELALRAAREAKGLPDGRGRIRFR